MDEDALAEFRDLILKVRGETIANFSGYLSGQYRNERAQALAAAYAALKRHPETLESYFLPEIVDEVLVILLQRLDESPFDFIHLADGEKAAVSLRDQTESLGSAYEFDWLPTAKEEA